LEIDLINRTAIVDAEDADEAAEGAVDLVRSAILAEIHERSLSDKAKPYTARRCREMVSCMVEAHFLNRDPGEGLHTSSLWMPDEGEHTVVLL
jgi:hypothetical protein